MPEELKPILLPGGHYKLERIKKKRKSPKAQDLKVQEPLLNKELLPVSPSHVNARTKSNFNGSKQVRRLKKVD